MLDLLMPRRRASMNMDDERLWYPMFGGQSTKAGVKVDEISAMNYSAVWRSCRILTETAAGLPCFLYETDGDDERKFSDDPLQDLIRFAPNPDMSAGVWRERTMLHQLNWHGGFNEIEFNRFGDPSSGIVALWPIHPAYVRRNTDRESLKEFPYIVTNGGGKQVAIRASEMLHTCGTLSEDGIWGRGVITHAREDIGGGKATDMHGHAYFGSGAQPKGILVTPGMKQEEDRRMFRKEWKEIHGSPDSSEIAIVPVGSDYKPITVSNADNQFLETRVFGRKVIMHDWYGLPLHMTGESVAHGSVEQAGMEFVLYSLYPWVRRQEEQYNLKLIPREQRGRKHFEHVFASLLRGDISARMNAYRVAIMIGVMTINECRRLENLNGIDEAGDQHFVPANMTTAERALTGDMGNGGTPGSDHTGAPADNPNDQPLDTEAAFDGWTRKKSLAMKQAKTLACGGPGSGVPGPCPEGGESGNPSSDHTASHEDRHDSERADLDEKHEAERAEAKSDSERKALQEKHKEEEKELEERQKYEEKQHEKLDKQQQKDNLSLEKEQAKDEKAMDKKHESETAKLNRTQDKEESEVDRKHEAERNDLNAKHGKEWDEHKANPDATRADKLQLVDKQHGEKNELNEKHGKEEQELADKHGEEHDKLEESQAEEYARLQEFHEAQQKELAARHDSQRAMLNKQQIEKRDEKSKGRGGRASANNALRDTESAFDAWSRKRGKTKHAETAKQIKALERALPVRNVEYVAVARAVLSSAFGWILQKEANAAQRAANNKGGDFEQWLREFYGKHEAFVAEHVKPACLSLKLAGVGELSVPANLAAWMRERSTEELRASFNRDTKETFAGKLAAWPTERAERLVGEVFACGGPGSGVPGPCPEGGGEDDNASDDDGATFDARVDEDNSIEEERSKEDDDISDQREKEDNERGARMEKEEKDLSDARDKEDAEIEKADAKREASREKEDSDKEDARAEEDAKRDAEAREISDARDKEDAELQAERDKEQEALDERDAPQSDYDKMNERHAREDEATTKARDKEDAKREKEDDAITKAREKEDAATEKAREKEDKAKEKEDAARERAREKEDKEMEKRHEAEAKADEARREKEDKEKDRERAKRDAELKAKREKEDRERQNKAA